MDRPACGGNAPARDTDTSNADQIREQLLWVINRAAADERLLDGLPGSAGRVLGLDLDACHVNAFRAELLAGQKDAMSWTERARFGRVRLPGGGRAGRDARPCV